LVSSCHQPQSRVHGRREIRGRYRRRLNWLLDEIALIQPYDKAVAAEEFQLWKLQVRTDHTATLSCEDGNGKTVFTKEIEFTDFPLDEIILYFQNNTIFLPSEY